MPKRKLSSTLPRKMVTLARIGFPSAFTRFCPWHLLRRSSKTQLYPHGEPFGDRGFFSGGGLPLPGTTRPSVSPPACATLPTGVIDVNAATR